MMARTGYPVKLFWFPFGAPQPFSLGLVSSSFLLQKRRQPRTGCYVAVDNEPRGLPDREEKQALKPCVESPLNSSDEMVPDHCAFRGRLRRQAKSIIRFFETESGLKRARALPSRIECGYLRSAIRRSFGHLTLRDELSFKTAQKVEKKYCKFCTEKLASETDKWKKKRFERVDVDDSHLLRFSEALRRNVEQGWNRTGIWPYIPNGHATAYNSRPEGGNWNEEPLDSTIEVAAIVSAGKPRIVTAFSGALTEVLFPMHKALYASLRRKGWLLVGSPTPDKVASLNGVGEYVSVDYQSATDNIKVAYTRAAVEVLIQLGEGLSSTQEWALRTVGNLTIDERIATRGQPMGSMMSFPLLCLINKTCVDLTLNDLLVDGEISFKEWTSHRCLINGDDLLLKSPTTEATFTYLPRLQWHGSQVGLVLQMEKTKVDAQLAEINSTLFNNCALEKKSNAGIFRSGDVSDVLGFADQSSRTVDGFIIAVRHLLPKLRMQVRKSPYRRLPLARWKALLHEARVCPKLKDALTTIVTEEPLGNAFPVCARPPGYALTAEEEKACIEARVQLLREKGYKGEKACGFHSNVYFTNLNVRLDVYARKSVQGNTSLRKALSRKAPPQEDNILTVLAREWNDKQYERLMEDDSYVDELAYEHVCDSCAAKSRISRMECEIRSNKGNSQVADEAVIHRGGEERVWRLDLHRETLIRVVGASSG